MVCIHFLYDLGSVYDWEYPTAFTVLKQWGGILFLLLSGVCVTLGSRHIRRGITVLACGMLCSTVTAVLYLSGLAHRGVVIYFGILHCLGTCMLLWSFFSLFPAWGLCTVGVLLTVVGLHLNVHAQVPFPWLVPLGILYPGFASADYFPMLPNLGFFLLGAFGGRTLYRNRQSWFPQINTDCLSLRFVCFCGRQSLLLYLLHQPILMGVLWLIRHFCS